ncbi:arsenic resistance protein [Nitrososphaera sp.]|uniref:bile acid:sodium symporter family protein n=1 Tax=Nitrososphaera sp. TaxID=1971748 RepID=UPI003173D0AC
MRRGKDALLASAIAGSILVGILLPQAGRVAEPYLLVWLGALLFLNLLRLAPRDLAGTFSRPGPLAALAAVKLVALPLAMYGVAYLLYPPFALPILLLAGISTGLGAPFVVNIVGGRLPLIVGMITVTSLAVPFVLPALVHVLVGSEFDLPLADMVILLVLALFIPLGAGWLTKRYAPSASSFADKNSFALSLVFVVLINMGMFSTLSPYFFSDQLFVLQTLAGSSLAYAAFAAAGYASAPKNERAAGLISMTYVNNTLVMVFAAQFFGPQVAALAAIYNLPYYAGILVLKRIICR